MDASGRLVWRDAPREAAAGRHLLSWPGRTASGAPAPAGLYLVSVEGGGQRLTRRVAVLH